MANPPTPVVVTGGTGFFGSAIARELVGRGRRVVVISRRRPREDRGLAGVEYVAADLAVGMPETPIPASSTIINCAAETSGGWTDHERNSVDVVRTLLKWANQAPGSRLLHISSTAVLAPDGDGAVSQQSVLGESSRSAGPYIWGKTESERLARRTAADKGIDLKIYRPSAILAEEGGETPGHLGRWVGPLFVAVGRRDEPMGVIGVSEAAVEVAEIIDRWSEVPPTLNGFSRILPTRGEMVSHDPVLRRTHVVWLPRFALAGLSTILRIVAAGRIPDLQRVFAPLAELPPTPAYLSLQPNCPPSSIHGSAPSSPDAAPPPPGPMRGPQP